MTGDHPIKHKMASIFKSLNVISSRPWHRQGFGIAITSHAHPHANTAAASHSITANGENSPSDVETVIPVAAIHSAPATPSNKNATLSTATGNSVPSSDEAVSSTISGSSSIASSSISDTLTTENKHSKPLYPATTASTTSTTKITSSSGKSTSTIPASSIITDAGPSSANSATDSTITPGSASGKSAYSVAEAESLIVSNDEKSSTANAASVGSPAMRDTTKTTTSSNAITARTNMSSYKMVSTDPMPSVIAIEATPSTGSPTARFSSTRVSPVESTLSVAMSTPGYTPPLALIHTTGTATTGKAAAGTSTPALSTEATVVSSTAPSAATTKDTTTSSSNSESSAGSASPNAVGSTVIDTVSYHGVPSIHISGGVSSRANNWRLQDE